MDYLIGLDDTDNLESRGTGYLARQLAHYLQSDRLAQVWGVTRHQLLISPEIKYTSHNSAVCILVSADELKADNILAACRNFLTQHCASGSDAGFCFVDQNQVTSDIQDFAMRAKQQVLHKRQAAELAQASRFYLEEISGNGSGIIGALAGVGLRAGGEDGRFLWLHGLRELNGVYTVEELLTQTGIQEVRSLDGNNLPMEAQVDVGSWVRPLLRAGKAILYVEEVNENGKFRCRILTKEHIKQLSN